MKFESIVEAMLRANASDIFIRAYSPLMGRVYADVKPIDDYVFSAQDVAGLIETMTPKTLVKTFQNNKSCEFAVWYRENIRLRFGIFFQRGTPSIVVRKINLDIPGFEELCLPGDVLEKFCREKRGLVLLTGITGSGKSTAIASMIEYINKNYGKHILTVEEPVEFTFKDKKSIINQREIGPDVCSYEDALRQFALHSPDVIFIGNIRDEKTCYAALTAAETGVLVFSTLHTVNAPSTIERIINFFPPHQHDFLLTQLSRLLKGVICLRLLPRDDESGLVPAYEIMTLSPTISRLMRENKLYDMPKYIASGDIYGMKPFDQSLLELVKEKKITPKKALEYADKREEIEMHLRNIDLL